MNDLAHIRARVLNRPQLCEPSYAQVLIGALSDRIGVDALTTGDQTHDSQALKAQADAFTPGSKKLYQQAGSIAVIPIQGALVHRSGYVGSVSGMVGYDGLQHQIQAALDDPEIRGILLDIDSPGGEVSGAFDLADQIYQARSQKRIWALADETAASAAYALASSAHRVIAPRTAQLGSIGVLVAHVDRSKQLEKAGLAVTLVHAGARKIDANPFQALPDSVRADLQTEIDSIYKLFVSTVSRNRGIDESRVKATEARLYTGQDAVTAGLADEVLPSSQVLQAFDAHLRGKRSNTNRTVATKPKAQPSMQQYAARYYGESEQPNQ